MNTVVSSVLGKLYPQATDEVYEWSSLGFFLASLSPGETWLFLGLGLLLFELFEYPYPSH